VFKERDLYPKVEQNELKCSKSGNYIRKTSKVVEVLKERDLYPKVEQHEMKCSKSAV
jgi:hypothetical protein